MGISTPKALKTLLLLNVFLVGLAAEIINTTTTTAGIIKGKTKTVSIDNDYKTVVEYLGIPFAEPPVGKLRFQHSILKSSNSTDMFEAFEYGPSCLQINPILMRAVENSSEDCLSLNIFSPMPVGTERYPVMFFIYGGGFVNGASSEHGGSRLAAYGEVVVVTINYRLGAFGFLSTGDERAPGNLGIIDQRTALRWVNANIDSFGGNSSMITIFGESAGSASVMYHMLFENETLFQRAIAQSGSINAAWSQSTPERQFNNAKNLAMFFNCSISSERSKASEEILGCLQTRKAEDILLFGSDLLTSSWVPIFDNSKLDTIQWPQKPNHTGELKDVYQGRDLLLGINRYEGHYFIETTFRNIGSMMKNSTISGLRTLFRRFLKNLITQAYLAADANSMEALLDAMMHLYTNAENPNDLAFNLKQVSDSLTDMWFLIAAYKDAASHVYMNDQTKTYQYEFNHVNPDLTLDMGSDWLKGASHGAELPYLFGFPTTFTALTPQMAASQWSFSKQIMDYWTNFAKSGNPNKPRAVPQEWKLYTNDKQEYLYFPNSGNPELKQFIHARRVTFWQDYVPQLLKRTTLPPPTPPRCPTSSATQTSLNGFLYISLVFILFVFYRHG
ncbi:acetylcholinesterase [Patella vulgata]|uniref:acetylcholinesterase n=1 Tax=Patella vulgata TaxID=6465 RepID=UPI00217FB2F2|nr:acetylcholinesterase [Patella vulgata]